MYIHEKISLAQLISAIAVMLSCITSSAQVRIVDATDSLPIVKATVIGASGEVIGMTSGNGMLPEKALGEKRFSVRHVAYETLNVDNQGSLSQVLTMQPIVNNLEEVAVRGPKLEYLYLRGYFRMYQLTDSVMDLYQEGYMDSFLKLKGKGAKEHKIYRKIKYGQGKEPNEYGLLPKESIVFVLMDPTVEGTTMVHDLRKKAGLAEGDTITVRNNKGAEAGFIHVNRKAGITTAQRDYLAFDSNHQLNLWILKVFGYRNFKVNRYEESEVYSSVEPEPSYRDLQGMFGMMEVEMMTKKKKGLHKVVCFGEYYVTDRKLLTKEKMKAMWKEPLPIETKGRPATVPAMSDAGERAVAEMTEYK